MPKITFIKNVDDEIIYPKTHENAILTEDGLTISSKLQSIHELLNHKSDSYHTHDYSSLSNIPTGFIANGGNSDTVSGKSVNDSKTGTGYLWTSNKISTELGNLNASIQSKAAVYIGSTEPIIETLWIDISNNVLKYKVNGSWKILGTELKYT